MFMNLYSLQWK